MPKPLVKEAQEIIATLSDGSYRAECPCCGEEIALDAASLFFLDDFPPAAEGIYEQKRLELKERARELRERKSKIAQRSETGAKAVNLGFILERLAPAMRSFEFEHNDCRSLFDPIDYVIFDGLSRRGEVERVLFVDIKTGDAKLQKNQKEIKALVEAGKVTMDTYGAEVGK